MTDPTGTPAPTWRELWARTTDTIGDRIRARWLCETAASAFGPEFDAELDVAATARMIAHLDAMLARARAGEPLQYVLGHWAFRHLDLAVDRRVLIPRPETELVAGAAIDLAATFGPIRSLADLGTGSGAIGLALADELPVDGTSVVLTDADGDALDVARANLAGLGPGARNVQVRLGSWTDALPPGERFDVVVSNPPYVAEGSQDVEDLVTDWEPASALFAGPDGLAAIGPIVDGVFDRLRPGGWLVLEIGADQGVAVTRLLAGRGYGGIEIRPDLAGRDRIALGQRPAWLFGGGGFEVRSLLNRLGDYALLLGWRRAEARPVDEELAAVLATYGPGGEHERDGVVDAIVEFEGRPAGSLLLYEVGARAAAFGLDEGTGIWSLELSVGDPDQADVCRRVLRAAAEHLRVDRGARDVVAVVPGGGESAADFRAAGFVDDVAIVDHERRDGVRHDGMRMIYRPG